MPPRLSGSQKKVLLAFILAWLIVSAADFRLLSLFRSLRPVFDGDLYYLLRIWGTVWTWLLISGAILLVCPRSPTPATLPPLAIRPKLAAAQITLSAVCGGVAAELLKLIFRRERPSDLEVYVFRTFSEEPWSSSGLGLPSSHAAVAFGGSLALITIFPRLRWPVLLMAIGCAATRLASGAHYPTDVLAGALVGWAASHTVAVSIRGLTARPSPAPE